MHMHLSQRGLASLPVSTAYDLAELSLWLYHLIIHVSAVVFELMEFLADIKKIDSNSL